MTKQLSDAIASVAPSATMAMTQAARELRQGGADVIGLSAGEPDFATPEHIVEAADKAMRDGHTGYTAVDGIPELKAAIIEKFERDNGLTFTPAQINVGPGGKAVLWNALFVTCGPGDEVIVPAPYWVSYPSMVRLTGATPVIIQGGADFKITPEQLEAAITPRTRWLMLNSPSNPSGAVYSAEELRGLAEVIRAHPHVMVLSDDIYEALVYAGDFATMASVAPDLSERILTMNGVSKAYAMTGFRIGYAGGPEWLISAMRKFMGQTTSNPATPSQHAAIAALNGDHEFLDGWRAAYTRRRDMMVERLGAVGLTAETPPGAFYVFADCEQAMAAGGFGTDADFAMALLKQAGVATVPGSAFGSPGHIRLSYAAADEQIARACDRIAEFVGT